MLNFKRRRNLAIFICFIIIVAWNTKIGFDLVKTDFKLFVVLDFSAILLFFLALAKSIKSKQIVVEAYGAYIKNKHAH